jgi:hypothetical protein
MQDKIKESLVKAEWCEEQAKIAADLKVRHCYLTLARGWRDFAAGPLARPLPTGGQRADEARSATLAPRAPSEAAAEASDF